MKYLALVLITVLIVARAILVLIPALESDDDVKFASQCSVRGVLPDPACTPGAIDPAVTQDNLQTTICASGYTKKVRPSSSYTTKLKKAQIKAYGYQDIDPKSYEEDHLISLELGGAPKDPANLWPEPGDSPNPKDKVENALHALVCAGKMPLSEAQHRIATDWTTAMP